MDAFGGRAAQLASIQNIASQIARDKKNVSSGQTSFFDNSPTESEGNEYRLAEIEEFGRPELLTFERELLGFYLSEHPLNSLLPKLKPKITHEFADLVEGKDGTKIKIGGLVTRLRVFYTKKNGQEMAFATIENELGSVIECLIFPKTFTKTKTVWIKDSVIIIEGHLDSKSERVVVIVDEATHLSS